jgi:hypothetical protein
MEPEAVALALDVIQEEMAGALLLCLVELGVPSETFNAIMRALEAITDTRDKLRFD